MLKFKQLQFAHDCYNLQEVRRWGKLEPVILQIKSWNTYGFLKTKFHHTKESAMKNLDGELSMPITLMMNTYD